MLKTSQTIIILFVFVLFTSCVKKNNTPRTEIINGVEHIYNTETPMNPDKTVTFEEEITIGKPDESGEIYLYQPSFFVVDKNNHVYVSDRSDQAIKVFDNIGNFTHTIGAKGEGPGEFQILGSLAITPDERLVTLDFMSRRTSIFQKDGHFLSSFIWKGAYIRLYLTTNTTITMDENIYRPERKFFIKAFDLEGNEKISYGEFTPMQMKTIRRGEGVIAVPIPVTVRSVFVGDIKNQLLYHCVNNTYNIEVYDSDGKLFRKIERPYKPVPFTKEDGDKFISQFKDTPVADEVKKVEMPDHKAIVTNMNIDDLGNLWVRTNEDKEIDGKNCIAYDIFNNKGEYDTRVWCDITPGVFANGKMYKRATDEETDVITIKRYKIIWK
jgi:hypothetical protein